VHSVFKVFILSLVATVPVVLAQAGDDGAHAQDPTVTATPTATATATPTPPPPAVVPAVAPYFALGDSLADAEGATSHEHGYVALFAAQAWTILGLPGDPTARAEYGLRGGETSTTMLAPGGQLDRATAEISRRNSDADPANDVRLITVDVGGNDFRVLTRSSSPCRISVTSPDCQQAVAGVVAEFTTNYPVILQRIRAAAGPDTIIMAMAFYNPFSGTGQSVDVAGDFVAAQITAQVRAVAVAPPVNAIFVDLFALFKGKAPELTHIADEPSDIHPNDTGYAVIASALAEALRDAVAQPETPAPPVVGTGAETSATTSLGPALIACAFLLLAASLGTTAVTARRGGGRRSAARPAGRGEPAGRRDPPWRAQ
jgi:lysophospholipase L1-like esterase